jgi:ribosomal protein S18 acetylase RimI-like enzyme
MGWAEVTAAVSELRPSARESARFATPIARLSVGESWREQFASERDLFAALRRRIAASEGTTVIVRVPSDLVGFVAEGVPAGHRALFAGTLLYWAIEVAEHTPASRPEGIDVRAADGSVDIGHIIADSFDGYLSHYAYNPGLEPGLIVAGYQEWATGAAASHDGSVLVLEKGGSPIGFATVVDDPAVPGIAEIELASVVSGAQGQGLYRHLLDGIVSSAADRGAHRVVISTQAHNIRVQRAWASAGLRPVASLETFHCVPLEAATEKGSDL